MKKIACVHTGMGALPGIIEKKFGDAVGGAKFYHILDSGLIGDMVAAGGMNLQLEERLDALFTAAAGTQPDVVVCTCSSIGEAAEAFAASNPGTNILRVDYPMAKYAAENGKKVAVLATLATTVEPSVRLVKRLAAEAGRPVEVVSAVAPGAFEAMIGGNMEAAAQAVVKTARELCSDADIVLLAQASMSNFAEALKAALGDVTMLNSPDTCAAYLKTIM
ncbi:aspartate/glutamate racemase family protein [Lacrimispora sp. 210928-DFI.3.58]|uniref:aspartate/glutamate racemase family protein n=1 Tax=Lacrimispora sp. 210928-DFI.3.58 TaxID=2883214 RepID=UPI001D05E0AC|nr:aspartate/glutamate racemase family protein [Lacrimispora sp. 210928-DFI.3.58]MCB7317467.1 aspartate/glutamate racemase family protein [Lacrimispora sp. 210928-DFI.3.58]